MKTLLLFFAALLFFSCGNEDDLVPQLDYGANYDTDPSAIIYLVGDYYSLEHGVWTSITDEDLKKLKVNDSIITISARTGKGELVYKIISQSVDGAFKIDAKTGVVLVNDDTVLGDFNGDEIYIDLEISNGIKTVNTKLTLVIDYYTTCYAARNKLDSIIYDWFEAKQMVLDSVMTRSYQFTFSVEKDKSLCAIFFPGPKVYTYNSTVDVQLLDNTGAEVINNKQSLNIGEDWFGEVYYYFQALSLSDITLVKDKAYTLIFTYNNAFQFQYHRNSEFQSVATPIEWGDLNIISFSYTDAEGGTQENTAIPYLSIGLKDF